VPSVFCGFAGKPQPLQAPATCLRALRELRIALRCCPSRPACKSPVAPSDTLPGTRFREKRAQQAFT